MTFIKKIVNYFDLTHSPVALYNFNDVLTDSSGNGLDLTLTSGATLFTKQNGITGLKLKGGVQYWSRPLNDPILTILKELTVEMLIMIPIISSEFWIVQMGSGTTAPNSNNAFSIRMMSTGNISYFADTGAGGTDVSYIPNISLATYQLTYLAMTRNSTGTVVKFYINGDLKATSGTLNAPTDGNSGVLRIGTNKGATTFTPNGGFLPSLKILNKELDSNQIKLEYYKTIGNSFGEV